MAGYIGSKTSVTVVSPETDSRYVNVTGDTMTGALSVTGGRLYVGQTAGDYAQFGKDTSGNAFIDATQSDADFGIYINSTSTGYNKKLGIDSAGRVTMPYQPAFFVSAMSASVGNYMNGGVVFVQNGGISYNSSTGAVTVPVAGNYRVTYSGFTNATNSYVQLSLRKNGVHFAYTECFAASNTFQYVTATQTLIVNMAANDYLQAYVNGGTVYNGGGGNTIALELIG